MARFLTGRSVRWALVRRAGLATVRLVPAPRPGDASQVAPYIPLPDGLADPRAVAGGVFDRIAALYDRARPGYPPDAVADLVRLCGLGGARRILEIGCGTGQLTRDLAASGADIVCVEPGRQLADIARKNLAARGNVEVVTASFEDFEAPTSSFDLVVSATAFHWIDPDVSYAKAASLLGVGGRLALLTNTHTRGGSHTDDRIAEAVRDLHRSLASEVGDWQFPTAEEIAHRASDGGDIAAVWARTERKLSEPPAVDHLFSPPTVKTYPWMAAYSTDTYLAVLASQSSYALMDPARLGRLLDGIGALLDERLDGQVTKEYLTVLAVAPRQPTSLADPVVVEVDDPRAGEVRQLLETHLAFSRSVTPARYTFALGVDQLIGPSVTFFSARRGGELLGVAALRHIDADHVELKSMHTRQDLRRQGIAEGLVTQLVAVAAERGYRRMSLETGTTDAFAPARALYQKLGFQPCGPFDGYHDSPYNTFMTITIEAPKHPQRSGGTPG
jgi:SAM-dependent methyltransferase/GNAT superfamily N-acetyltransferase